MLFSVVEYQYTLFEIINSKWFLPDTHVRKSLTSCQQDICVRNRLVTNLSTSCKDVVSFSNCYKIVTDNFLTSC
jgi:hypothetical protein